MPKCPNANDRAEEMETLRAALAIVRTARIELDEKVPILPTKCSRYLIAADADLLVVPAKSATAGDHHVVEDIMGLSRCDALMVYVARPGTGANRVVVESHDFGGIHVLANSLEHFLVQGLVHHGSS